MKLIDYFDKLCIVHLPNREDRYRALEHELRVLGIDICGPKVQVPPAPMPADANGYQSKGVHGNFLSHYEILRDALKDGVESVWVLEDDAIFSRYMVSEQERTVDVLSSMPWGLCYFGHTLRRELKGAERGWVPFSGPFCWAHCYAVHSRTLARLVSYMEETMENPPGHPRGGRLYIDAAYTLFRQMNPDVLSLVANPVMSVQKGSPSSISERKWYDHFRFGRLVANAARAGRDECWRRTGWYACGSGTVDL
ncbi:MAG: hypothetical protein FWD61_01625 [Phycisphaerales bacterium]|nr:hypothetical protein [Phycisphaerales bacterium]